MAMIYQYFFCSALWVNPRGERAQRYQPMYKADSPVSCLFRAQPFKPPAVPGCLGHGGEAQAGIQLVATRLYDLHQLLCQFLYEDQGTCRIEGRGTRGMRDFRRSIWHGHLLLGSIGFHQEPQVWPCEQTRFETRNYWIWGYTIFRQIQVVIAGWKNMPCDISQVPQCRFFLASARRRWPIHQPGQWSDPTSH